MDISDKRSTEKNILIIVSCLLLFIGIGYTNAKLECKQNVHDQDTLSPPAENGDTSKPIGKPRTLAPKVLYIAPSAHSPVDSSSTPQIRTRSTAPKRVSYTSANAQSSAPPPPSIPSVETNIYPNPVPDITAAGVGQWGTCNEAYIGVVSYNTFYEGDKVYLQVDVEIRNNRNALFEVDYFDFEARNIQGKIFNNKPYSGDPLTRFTDYKIAPGNSARGFLYFEVPVTEPSLNLYYKSNGKDRITFHLW